MTVLCCAIGRARNPQRRYSRYSRSFAYFTSTRFDTVSRTGVACLFALQSMARTRLSRCPENRVVEGELTMHRRAIVLLALMLLPIAAFARGGHGGHHTGGKVHVKG